MNAKEEFCGIIFVTPGAANNQPVEQIETAGNSITPYTFTRVQIEIIFYKGPSIIQFQ